jgi:exopolysaccharide biosynthesis WecB/TagA/CpsF family protein
LTLLERHFAEEERIPAIQRQYFLDMPFDKITFDDVVELLGKMRNAKGFRYIVTPNVDHVVRFSTNKDLRPYYENAWLTLCDSKPLALLARIMPLSLPRVTGSDLTASVFNLVIRDGDHIALIAPNATVAERMQAKYPRLHIRFYVPPFGVGKNPTEIARCVEFAVREKAAFTFIAIGSPQSEKIAYAMSEHGRAAGIGLCIGASLEFLTGMKRRAPHWMRKAGIEWMHRLASDPKRLWRRYAFAVIPLLRLTLAEFRERRAARSVSSPGG